MTTIENNKLIAEFMGVRHTDDSKYLETLKEMKSDGLYFEQGYMTSELHYYTDWRWLMEVVDKINNLNNLVQIHDNHVKIVNNTKSEVLVDVIEGSMFEAIYSAVVEFIKNYKNN
jgi:hypothetical protein